MIRPGSMMVSRAGARLAKRKNECACCGDELDAHQAASSGVCDRQRCREWKIAQVGAELLQRRRRQILERLFEEAAPSVSTAAAAIGGEPDTVVRAIVPWQARPVEPLPQERRAAFHEHLRWIAEDGFLAEPPGEDEERAGIERDEPPVLSAACAVCRGRCCDRGGVTAMLGEDDVGRWRARNPGAAAAQFVADYMTALPEETVAGSCVCLTAAGCALPRHMRSDWCNASQCAERDALQAALAESGGDRVVFVADDAARERAGAVAGWSPQTGAVEAPVVEAAPAGDGVGERSA